VDAVTKTYERDRSILYTTGQDGLVYDERRLHIRLAFLNGFFMKIEQKKDYSG
jgi:hypothetical protein